MITLTGQLAVYELIKESVERAVDADGALVRMGIPDLHIWALPDEGDGEPELIAALAQALDDVWREMARFFDNSPTPYECDLVERFCRIVQDVHGYDPDSEPMWLGDDPFHSYLFRAWNSCGPRPGELHGRRMLRWYAEHIVGESGSASIFVTARTRLDEDSLFGWRPGVDDEDEDDD